MGVERLHTQWGTGSLIPCDIWSPLHISPEDSPGTPGQGAWGRRRHSQQPGLDRTCRSGAQAPATSPASRVAMAAPGGEVEGLLPEAISGRATTCSPHPQGLWTASLTRHKVPKVVQLPCSTWQVGRRRPCWGLLGTHSHRRCGDTFPHVFVSGFWLGNQDKGAAS